MAGFLFKLETPNGEPAEPSSLSSAVPNWAPGETIHVGHRTVRVVGGARRRSGRTSGAGRGDLAQWPGCEFGF